MPSRNIDAVLANLNGWRAYKKEHCSDCEAACCYMPVEVKIFDLVRLGVLDPFYLELSEREQIKAALEDPSVSRYSSGNGKFTLAQQSSGACYFLDANKRCTRYENRPDTCRNHPQIGPRPGFCAYIKKVKV